MSLYYNSDGELEYFEETTRLVLCPNCGKPYRQDEEEQVAGFRDKDYDICPYCQHENGSSMSVEYTNYPLSEDEIAQYFKNTSGGDIDADSK